MENHLIQINNYADFKENFGDIYVEKAEKEKPRNILPEYRRDSFTFQMPVDVFAESLKSFLLMHKNILKE